MAGRARNGKARKRAGGAARGGKQAGMLGSMRGMLNRGLQKAAELATPTDDAVDAIDMLKVQHRHVEKLFAQIESARGSRKRALFNELADMLAMHATIEEKVFYPNVKRDSTRDLLLESVEEHLGMKRTLADLLEMDVNGDDFDARISVLQEQVVHHAKKEEEGKLFPILRTELDSDFLAALAGEMIGLMVDLEQEQKPPRAHVPMETSAPAPI
jgi:hemerythrin superfamily protein